MSSNEPLTIKKIPFYLFLVLLGFLICYVFNKVNSPEDQNHIPPIASKAGPIPEQTAKEYIHNYLATQDSMGREAKIVTSNGETLRGFWISKQMLKSIDSIINKSSKTNKVVGYSIYFGKDATYSKDKRQTINLVVRGTIPVEMESASQPKTMMKLGSSAGIDFTDAGDYFDMVEACPTRCGSTIPGN